MVRLKASVHPSVESLYVFQFLMVRLKDHAERQDEADGMFQFLMVRLKAGRDICVRVKRVVSIPYGTIKSRLVNGKPVYNRVSIPYGTIKR